MAATELWLTDDVDEPTWLKQPKERVRVLGGSGQCPANRLEFDNAPSERLVHEGDYERVTMEIPSGFLRDDQTYSWTATGIDGDLRSAPSRPCRFTTDFTPPATKPKVTSELYPENSTEPGTGGADVPGEFVLDALGDKDITTFSWSTSQRSGTAVADRPGGAGRVMIKPEAEGEGQYVRVCGSDRVGNKGPCKRSRRTRTAPRP